MEAVDNQKASLLSLATYWAVFTALTLIAAKLGAWFITGSLTILASLIDSIMDAATSFINFFAVRYSLKSADDEHQFGHGKAEALSGLVQASFIAGSALLLIINTTGRIKNPQPLTKLGAGISIMVFSIILTFVLIIVQRHVIKKTQSTAIKADSLHYLTDLLTNLCTIGALILVSMGIEIIDSVFALGIAFYILYSSYQIGYESCQLLMDRQLPPEIQKEIQKIVLANENVLGIHDLRTRKSGLTMIFILHLDLEGNLSLNKAHSVAKDVESELKKRFPDADITIHQDPV